ncbi:MAG: ABC transporter permease subunit [Anaerolineae bacterium]
MVAVKPRLFFPTSALAARLILVGVFDVAVLWLVLRLLADGSYPLAAVLSVMAIFLTASYTVERFKAFRWLALGLSLTMLFVLYPILYTFYLSTTNTGYGHILTSQQAAASFLREQYVPEGSPEYRWTAFQSPNGTYALWLVAEDGTAYLTRAGELIEQPAPGTNGIGELDEDGIPQSIEGYQRLARRDVVPLIDQLSRLEFGTASNIIRITGLTSAAATQQRYRYDEQQGTLTDQETGTVYHPVRGTFISDAGEELRPGFFVDVGLENFNRFFNSAALRGPLAEIVTWNFAYAIFSVLFSFSLGLFIAVLFDDLPGKRIIRTLLIIPYPIPALVSILIWRNLLNPDFGALVQLQEALTGSAPNWLTDYAWTRIAIILINMWLSYPYFYIVSSGALQAIPTEMLDAAAVDGANGGQRFFRITLPLLLQIVSPLLVASFAFNFNNFNLIYIFNQGNPPIAGSPIPAGHTDILISFVYTLAFNSAQSDYGLAAAISIVLFAFVAVITWAQFRYTRILGENN